MFIVGLIVGFIVGAVTMIAIFAQMYGDEGDK